MITEKKYNFRETSVSVKLFSLAVPESEFEILVNNYPCFVPCGILASSMPKSAWTFIFFLQAPLQLMDNL